MQNNDGVNVRDVSRFGPHMLGCIPSQTANTEPNENSLYKNANYREKIAQNKIHLIKGESGWHN